MGTCTLSAMRGQTQSAGGTVVYTGVLYWHHAWGAPHPRGVLRVAWRGRPAGYQGEKLMRMLLQGALWQKNGRSLGSLMRMLLQGALWQKNGRSLGSLWQKNGRSLGSLQAHVAGASALAAAAAAAVTGPVTGWVGWAARGRVRAGDGRTAAPSFPHSICLVLRLATPAKSRACKVARCATCHGTQRKCARPRCAAAAAGHTASHGAVGVKAAWDLMAALHVSCSAAACHAASHGAVGVKAAEGPLHTAADPVRPCHRSSCIVVSAVSALGHVSITVSTVSITVSITVSKVSTMSHRSSCITVSTVSIAVSTVSTVSITVSAVSITVSTVSITVSAVSHRSSYITVGTVSITVNITVSITVSTVSITVSAVSHRSSCITVSN